MLGLYQAELLVDAWSGKFKVVKDKKKNKRSMARTITRETKREGQKMNN